MTRDEEKKDLKYYQSIEYERYIRFDPEDRAWVVSFPALAGCIAHGESIEKAIAKSDLVKDEWLEIAYTEGCTRLLKEADEGKP